MMKFQSMTKPHRIQNISNVTVPDYVSLGPNFVIPYKYKEIPVIRTLSGIENAL